MIINIVYDYDDKLLKTEGNENDKKSDNSANSYRCRDRDVYRLPAIVYKRNDYDRFTIRL